MEWQRLEHVPLSQLTPYPGNARRGDVEAIAESLATFGQYRALIVRQDPGTNTTLTILAGNHTAMGLARLLSMTAEQVTKAYGEAAAGRWAQQLGQPDPVARCEIITCDDAEARKINAADNRLAELGGYDDVSLLAQLTDMDGDFTGTGWSDNDLQRLAEPAPAPDGFPDLDPDMDTEYCCPRCSYEWSGKPR